ncbi:MAG: hypothetical protein CML56_05120 [Rhodobacteraceae bacterium]|nr:hypothetical protein [Paracoccaceae bacterium]
MIQFSLVCDRGHSFDSWFKSTAAFEKLNSAGMVSCSLCGSDRVEKAIMAPRVTTSKKQAPSLKSENSPAEQALKELRNYVEKNSDYVGTDFVKEARDIHDGNSPERSIFGEAKPAEAKKLLEDGIPVTPLPFSPKRKSN